MVVDKVDMREKKTCYKQAEGDMRIE